MTVHCSIDTCCSNVFSNMDYESETVPLKRIILMFIYWLHQQPSQLILHTQMCHIHQYCALVTRAMIHDTFSIEKHNCTQWLIPEYLTYIVWGLQQSCVGCHLRPTHNRPSPQTTSYIVLDFNWSFMQNCEKSQGNVWTPYNDCLCDKGGSGYIDKLEFLTSELPAYFPRLHLSTQQW